MDCQADRLLKLFGYYKDKHLTFPSKIEVIKKFDIIAPRVLTKINRTRNQLEHDFIKPDPAVVEDYLDIASLFVAATELYASYVVSEVEYEGYESDIVEHHGYAEIAIDNKKGKLFVKARGFGLSKPMSFEIDKSHSHYIDVFKWHIKKVEYR